MKKNIYKGLFAFVLMLSISLIKPTGVSAFPLEGQKMTSQQTQKLTSKTSLYLWQNDIDNIKATIEKKNVPTARCANIESDAVVPDNYIYGYIYLGDSRFVGMDSSCGISEKNNTFVVAKTSMGYNWLRETAEDEIKNIMSENPDITKWVIISGLGVNDLGNAKNYISEYERLLSSDWANCDFYFLTVNPVEYHSYITNEDIESFNTSVEDAGFKTIDSYSVLNQIGYSTLDGVHYDNTTYEKISNIIFYIFS